jgi:hypothetical protein
MAKQIPWEAVAATLIAIFGFLGWVFRRAWGRVHKELKMLREVYAFAFGAEEVGMSLEDDSVEERLARGAARFDYVAESQERLERDQQKIYDRQEEIAVALGVDDEVGDVALEGLPDWEPGRYRNEREDT